MCLDLKWWSRKRIATKDIIVYKVVTNYCWNPGYSFRSSYQSMPIKIGETYNVLQIVKCRARILQGFHSLKSLKATNELLQEDFRRCIVKCIIPKGSTYYNGIFERCQLFNPIGYVSDSIKYVELLK